MRNLSTFLLALLSCICLEAQTVDFFADQVSILPNNQISVDIRVRNFNNVVSNSFTLSWDTTIIQYLGVTHTGLAGTAARPETYRSSLTYLWIDFDLSGENLADSASIFRVNFQAIGAPGSTSPLSFSSTPSAMAVAIAPFTPGTFNPINGSVAIDFPQPVELSLFTGETVAPGTVKLDWRTEQEVGNSHFVLERSVDGQIFEVVDEIKGKGTTQEPVDYSYTDRNVPGGFQYYRLKQIDFDGQSVYSNTVEVFVYFPNLSLGSFPNPSSGISQLEVVLPETSPFLALRVMDAAGRVVRSEFLSDAFQPGRHLLPFDGSQLPAGLYTCEVKSGGSTGYTRLLIAR